MAHVVRLPARHHEPKGLEGSLSQEFAESLDGHTRHSIPTPKGCRMTPIAKAQRTDRPRGVNRTTDRHPRGPRTLPLAARTESPHDRCKAPHESRTGRRMRDRWHGVDGSA